eukprot:2057782-Pyramimonas_sp.AAC.1
MFGHPLPGPGCRGVDLRGFADERGGHDAAETPGPRRGALEWGTQCHVVTRRNREARFGVRTIRCVSVVLKATLAPIWTAEFRSV